MSKVKTRSFTVPVDRQWSAVLLDGDGPCIAQPGETVMVIVAHSWESAMREAMERLAKPEPADE